MPMVNALKYLPMDAAEYQHVIDVLGVTGNEFSRIIGISIAQGKRYRTSKAIIPPVVAVLVRTILRNRLRPDRIG